MIPPSSVGTDWVSAEVPASAGGIYDILERDFSRPENRYLNTPLVQLITSGRLPKSRLKDYAVLRWPFQARADLVMSCTRGVLR